MDKLLMLLLAVIIGGTNCHEKPGEECMFWTPWISSDKPIELGDFETLRFPTFGFGTYITNANGEPGTVAKTLWTHYGISCNHPLEIQCRDVNTKAPFHQTSDFTLAGHYVKCTTDEGLICRKSEQANGQCKDYEVRLLCWHSCAALAWTPWVSRDTPPGTGDGEGHQLSTPLGTYEPCPGGSSPYDIQCRRAGTLTPALMTGQKRLSCDRNWGLKCLNSFNLPGGCFNYLVRYLCRNP